jgi:hypothetical protein
VRLALEFPLSDAVDDRLARGNRNRGGDGFSRWRRATLVVDNDAGDIAVEQAFQIMFAVEQEALAPERMAQLRSFHRMYEHAHPDLIERHPTQHDRGKPPGRKTRGDPWR